MNPTKLTNLLLGIIAALLLTLVIQNAFRSARPDLEFPADMMTDPGHPPMAGGMEGRDFHSSSMVIGSLNCPSDAALTLSDPTCSGTEADHRRRAVEAAMDRDLPISKVYDLVVEQFGEKALTEPALEIWKKRAAAKKD